MTISNSAATSNIVLETFVLKDNFHNSRFSDDIEMKIGPITKHDKRNKTTPKNLAMTSCRKIVTSLPFFPISGQFGSIRESHFRRIIYKAYIFINSNLLFYKSWKQNWKNSNTALTLLLWVKVPNLPKNADFLQKMSWH